MLMNDRPAHGNMPGMYPDEKWSTVVHPHAPEVSWRFLAPAHQDKNNDPYEHAAGRVPGYYKKI